MSSGGGTQRSTPTWYLIPANHKWYRNYLVAKIIVATLKEMDPRYPPAPPGIDYRRVKIPT